MVSLNTAKKTFQTKPVPKPHMVTNSIHNFKLFLLVNASVKVSFSPFTTTRPNVCLWSHRQGINSSSLAKSNTHFHCQTQIFTLSCTQTLSHSLPWYNRHRGLQSINQNLLWRTRLNPEEDARNQNAHENTQKLPLSSDLGHNGAF